MSKQKSSSAKSSRKKTETTPVPKPALKLADIIILSLGAVFVIIGIHQTITLGFGNGYWAMMLALICFFILNLRKRRSS